MLGGTPGQWGEDSPDRVTVRVGARSRAGSGGGYTPSSDWGISLPHSLTYLVLRPIMIIPMGR